MGAVSPHIFCACEEGETSANQSKGSVQATPPERFRNNRSSSFSSVYKNETYVLRAIDFTDIYLERASEKYLPKPLNCEEES